MVAFFGCLYYAALRPEEAVDLRRDNLASLPVHGWGELILTNSEPRSGTWWTDSGSARQRRELKHRPRGETRPVPLHPELVALLSEHLKQFPPGLDGRIFTGPRGGIFNDRAYLLIFHKARAAAFSRAESASLLARRPLRPAPRGGLHLVERRSTRPTGRRLGGPQRRLAAAGLRQVHLRSAA